MSDKKRIGFHELMDIAGSRVKEVVLAAGVVTLKSASSDDVLQWFKDNSAEPPKPYAGLRMLVISLTDAEGNRVPVEKREEVLIRLLARDYKENDLLAAASLVLNGLRKESPDVAGAAGTPAPEGGDAHPNG